MEPTKPILKGHLDHSKAGLQHQSELSARSRRSCVTTGQRQSFAVPRRKSLAGRKASTCPAAMPATYPSHLGKSSRSLLLTTKSRLPKTCSKATQGKAIAAPLERWMIYSIAWNDSFGVGLVCLVRAVLQAGLSVPGAASPRGPAHGSSGFLPIRVCGGCRRDCPSPALETLEHPCIPGQAREPRKRERSQQMFDLPCPKALSTQRNCLE